MAVIITGLLTLFFATECPLWSAGVDRSARRACRSGGAGAVRRAAGRGWRRAQAGGRCLGQRAGVEKSVRFASAEAIRWLEWGVRSYQSFMLGVTFLLSQL